MFPLWDTIPSRRVPVVTYSIIAVNVFFFLVQLLMPEQRLEYMLYLFGLVPKRFVNPVWAAEVGFPYASFLPFITNMFLHGGWLHIISNMWSLWIFGDNVEDRMGPVRFLAFYMICGLVANVIHVFTNPGSTMPVIGASGAIAGVLGAYFVLFPMARVLCLIPIFIYPLLIEIPAFVFIVIWSFMQLFNGALSLLSTGHVGGVAWWAHIGGFTCGIILYRAFLRNPPRQVYRAA
jgi:membrane associated rhomboid family serine protease